MLPSLRSDWRFSITLDCLLIWCRLLWCCCQQNYKCQFFKQTTMCHLLKILKNNGLRIDRSLWFVWENLQTWAEGRTRFDSLSCVDWKDFYVNSIIGMFFAKIKLMGGVDSRFGEIHMNCTTKPSRVIKRHCEVGRSW